MGTVLAFRRPAPAATPSAALAFWTALTEANLYLAAASTALMSDMLAGLAHSIVTKRTHDA